MMNLKSLFKISLGALIMNEQLTLLIIQANIDIITLMLRFFII